MPQSQLREMIARDHNQAAIVLWSLSNETALTPERWIFSSSSHKMHGNSILPAFSPLRWFKCQHKLAFLVVQKYYKKLADEAN
jgi:hypothetical protein